MKRFIQRASELRHIDWWLFLSALFLVSLGLVIQYSIGLNQDIPSLQPFYKQLVIALIGFAGFFFFSFTDYRALKTHPSVYVAGIVVLLIGVLLFGETIKGTTGWFVVGSFSLQPVEFVKMLFIFFMATFFEKDPVGLIQQRKALFTSGGITALMLGLIILQPDLGSSIMLFIIWFIYQLVLRAPKWFLGAVLLSIVVVSLVGWFFLFEDYQKDRLTVFLNPEAQANEAGYNITQSIVAIGSGSLWGRGLGAGTQSQLHFLPEASSDFVFAVIAEELGFIGVIVTLSALGIIIFRLWKYMNRSKNYYSFLIVLGTCSYISTQSIFLMGMNAGLFPVTGVPLPLVSAGGSSMLMTLWLLGIAHNIGISQKTV